MEVDLALLKSSKGLLKIAEMDVFNSLFAAAFMFILSMVAVSTFTVKGTLSGGIMGFVAAALWSLDGYILFKKITFNKPRTTTRAQTGEE
ncbi:chemokine-like factor [Danio rerio]|uniref:Chemokine-like factor n=1 Tax=Danio rerio TaxID=7955 RepID=A0AC58G0U8_DANRE